MGLFSSKKEKTEKFSWEQKAEAALKAGQEELAVKALSRATEHEQNFHKIGGATYEVPAAQF